MVQEQQGWDRGLWAGTGNDLLSQRRILNDKIISLFKFRFNNDVEKKGY